VSFVNFFYSLDTVDLLWCRLVAFGSRLVAFGKVWYSLVSVGHVLVTFFTFAIVIAAWIAKLSRWW